MLSSRSLISQYVSCVDRRRDERATTSRCTRCRCTTARSWTASSAATSTSARPASSCPGPDPAAMLATIERERVTKLFCPPTVWISLLRHPDFDATDLSSLRKGYYGASAMPVEVLREMQRRLPDVALWNFYGQTEMAPLATILRPARAAGAGRRGGPGGAQRRDPDRRRRRRCRSRRAQIGEIVHRSPHATLGYYDDEAKTAEAFRGGWFHSGDLGVLDDDGYLSVVDRKKDMIKTGGENVASREVEEVIYQLDGVAEVAVFGIATRAGSRRSSRSSCPRPASTLTAEDVQRARPRAARRRQEAQVRRRSSTRCRRTRAARSSSASCGRRTPPSPPQTADAPVRHEEDGTWTHRAGPPRRRPPSCRPPTWWPSATCSSPTSRTSARCARRCSQAAGRT